MTTDSTPPGTLYERTRELLKTDPRGILDIHKASNVPFYWLRKFQGGEIKDPGVNRVQRLYEFLTDRPLPLK
jgi:hypothetical protein